MHGGDLSRVVARYINRVRNERAGKNPRRGKFALETPGKFETASPPMGETEGR